MPSPVLSVRGNRIVDAAGETVTLRGYNIGGWMNMENFLTGYPGSESQQRRALLDALGPALYDAFFDRFMTVFFDEADAAYLASLGLNSVRIPFNYRHFEDDSKPFELKESGFALLERAIGHCQRHGPAVAGYNLMNEPGDPGGTVVKPFYDRAVQAVRAVDPDHIIFLDGNRYSTDFSIFDAPLYENTVYAAHDYALPGFIYGGPYPGITQGVFVDRAQVEQAFLKRTEFMRSTGTPIWIGEFGPLYTEDPERDDQRYQLLEDQLDIYREYGASWSIWAYKDIGAQGLVSAAEDSPWQERIREVTAKKARLGVDSWGSLDTGVRHIMTPIEETFANEYPDFGPFPFGQGSWLMTLVRSIVLAEPMVEDFGRCFAGITDEDTVLALADSFRLDRCVVRDRLAAVLSAAAREPV